MPEERPVTTVKPLSREDLQHQWMALVNNMLKRLAVDAHGSFNLPAQYQDGLQELKEITEHLARLRAT